MNDVSFEIENGDCLRAITGTKEYDFGQQVVINRISYNLRSLAWFVFEKNDEENLADGNNNEILNFINETRNNLSKMYINLLELRIKGKIDRYDIEESYESIPSQIDFLDRLAEAFGKISCTCEEVKTDKVKKVA